MLWVYIAATIFGGSFLIPMLMGGLSSDIADSFGGDADLDVGDVDVEMDMDLDAEVEFDGDVDNGGDTPVAGGIGDFDTGSPLGAIFSSLLSFRTVVFFTAFFGVAGLAFDALGYSGPETLGTAILIGTIAAVINSTLFGLIKNSQPNSQISDRTLEGRPATVVLPMDSDQRGRIRIDLSGQPQYLVAQPLDDGSNQQFGVGASVVVVKIENGTALVSSLAELETGEEL